MSGSARPCGATHYGLGVGNYCREPVGHRGQHMAHDSQGRPEYVWTPEPGSPMAPHDRQCEMGLRYGPWTDCGCLERSR